jgi:hypothetical protein
MAEKMEVVPRNGASADLVPARERSIASAETENQRAIAEVQAAMVMAQRMPRDEARAIARIEQAFTRPKLAESAMYQYAKGGTDVTGPSIRAAETIAQAWGNMQFGVRELEQRDGESTVESFAWDLETNTRSVKQFQVTHFRDSRNGRTRLVDSRDIYEHVANQGARRLRACILSIVPGDVVESAMKQAEDTLRNTAEITPEYIQKVVAAFDSVGVSREMLQKRMQRPVESMTPALAVQLNKIYNSIKDGLGAPSDYFDLPTTPTPSGTTRTAQVKDQLRANGGEKVNGDTPATHDELLPPGAPADEQQSGQSKLRKKMWVHFKHAQKTEREDVLDYCETLFQREIVTTNDLNDTEVQLVIDSLEAEFGTPPRKEKAE